MELTNTVTIDRPIDSVFAAWSELHRIPEWYEGSLERRKITDGPIGVGTKYHAIDKVPPGRTMEGTLEVTAFEPNRYLAVTLSAPYNSEWEVTLEDVDGAATVMTMHIDARMSGLQGLFAPLLRGWAQRTNQKGLDNFKASMERPTRE